MKVLLTGAGGSIGYETFKQLIEKEGVSVIALDLETKKNKKRLDSYQNRAQIIYGSINNKHLIESIISKVDVVIHLAAIIPPLADQNPDLTRMVNFFGTQNIVDAIRTQNKDCFLLYASSVSVYGDRTEKPWIQVGDPLLPSEGDYYAHTKIETEKMIRESKIHYSIFRLTGIMGRPDIDPLMFHMPLDTKLEISTTPDTATAFVNALFKQRKLDGKIFNLGGGKFCRTTYREFLIHMFQIYGLKFSYLKEFYFAEKNFHCGYFLDGDILENIIHFRYDTLESYYARVEAETKKSTRFFSKLLSKPILFFLTRKSEPLQAQKKRNTFLINRFFKKRK